MTPRGSHNPASDATVTFFHVTSSMNRESIEEFGLDWSRMGSARGIAGSYEPEQKGCFLCEDESETNWFIRMNNTGGTVDVWEVTGVSPSELVQSPEGHFFVPRTVPKECMTLVRPDIQQRQA
jgi:hypothetical protein